MELILVMVVISVVLAISAPSLRGFLASRQTANAAGTVLSLVRWAQTHAVAQGCPARLNVDPATGAYWVTVQDMGKYVAPAGETGRRFTLPEGAAISLRSDTATAAPTYLQFYPSGRCDPGTIEIRGREGEVFLVFSPSATDPFRVIAPSEKPGQ
jgi:Tfp pilus assembly protein FimT